MTEKDRFWVLLTAKMHNELDGSELIEFDLFLKNEEYKKIYLQMQELNTDLQIAGNLKSVSSIRSWQRIKRELRSESLRLIANVVKYAAIIVLAFLLGNVLTNKFNKTNTVSGFAEVRVPLGQMTELTLYDGTRVWLNSGTTLRYNNDFGIKERFVALEGEAFFDVAKTGSSFKVMFRNKEVEVLGTRFNIVAYPDENISQVTLVEGKVNLNAGNGNIIAQLQPSQQINIDEQTQKANIELVETNFYVSWTEGKIVFEQEKLSEISKKLERWYNVDIQFEDDSITALDFSGTILKNKPFDQIIKAFEILLPIKIKYTHVPGAKDIVFISKK
ncbi:FecR domain-containing protein [uncultured Draconibacterium sp.]|uniref:FecR family protein n=1 Tax=uncultured Draconibacterium sp. TaxID=1573823 RepID=UPI0032178F1A